MKIALTLSGQIRSFEIGYLYLKRNLLDHYEVDVFIHTWSRNWNDNVINLYRPKDILIEDDSIFKNFSHFRAEKHRPFVTNPIRNTVLMFRSIKYSDLLRQAYHEKYDFVVRSRFDFALNCKINFEDLNKSKMYFCDTRSNESHTEIHDQFAIGIPDYMKTYSKLYDHIDEYHDDGCSIIGEHLLEHHMKKENMIPDKIEYLNLNPPFIGGLYNYGKHSLIRDDRQNWL